MPHELLLPTAILAQTNLVGSIGAIRRNAKAKIGLGFLTAPGANNATETHVRLATPQNPLIAGAGLQEIAFRVRKTNHSTDPTCTATLEQDGTQFLTLLDAAPISNTGNGALRVFAWDATGRDASLVEVRIVGTPGGGSPNNRASLEVGPITWNAAIVSEHVYRRRVPL